MKSFDKKIVATKKVAFGGATNLSAPIGNFRRQTVDVVVKTCSTSTLWASVARKKGQGGISRRKKYECMLFADCFDKNCAGSEEEFEFFFLEVVLHRDQ